MAIMRTAKTIYVDGTFKIVRKPFYQLVGFHCFIKQKENIKQIPGLFVLMSSKTEKDYSDLLSAIVDFAGGVQNVSWQTVMLDFEAATWKAFKTILPNIVLMGCNFHFTQAIYRNIQKFGLSPSYLRQGKTFKFCRCLMALAFLPYEHILPSFELLQE